MIEVSLSVDYCPTWKAWEGVRELVQNWLDERDTGKPATMEHEGDTLTLWNEGAEFARHQMALFGSTTKTGGERGKFGEGFKIGVMALVRCGLDVSLDTPHGSYRAAIEVSKMYEAKVLVFHRESDEETNGVRLVVEGITPFMWETFKERFLWDTPPNSILFDKPGAVYVKDIWVAETGLRLGYNLSNVKTDRDRKLVDPWDLKWATARVINESLALGVISPEKVVQLLEDQADDVTLFDNHITATTRPMINAAFKEKHGEEAVAVCTVDDFKEAEHHGLTPVLAPPAVCGILEESNKKVRAATEVSRKVATSDLEPDERNTLMWAVQLLSEAGVEIEAAIDIVSFIGDDTLGRRQGGNIYMARKVLSDRVQTLQTLVEEVAHAKGPDGSMDHKWELHRIYAALVVTRTSKEDTDNAEGQG